jgi:hypothetical protein
MAAADLEAILSGGHLPPFVTLDDLHWVESVWSEQEGSWTTKVTAYGRDREWCWHTGVMHVRPETILAISELRDCSALLGRAR